MKKNLRRRKIQCFQGHKHDFRQNLRTSLGPRGSLVILLTSALLLSTGCKKDQEESQNNIDTSSSKATKSPASGTKAKALAPKQTPPTKKPPISTPTGPQQIVLPGKGLSAIRFGATKKTIERHMLSPCEFSMENRCVYVSQALEFFLTPEGLEKVRIHVYNHDASNVPGAERNYGTFNGVLPVDIRPGLHRHIVLSEYGEPLRIEKPETVPHFGLQERHFYDGIILEYDRIQNGNIVLAALEIIPSKSALSPHEYHQQLRKKRLEKNLKGKAQ